MDIKLFSDSSDLVIRMNTARGLHMQGYDGCAGGRKADEQLSSGRRDLLCRSRMPYTRGCDGHAAK
jgi:hypothetical protein